jgi:hypothetical protein
MDITSKYKNIGGINMDSEIYPVYFKPNPIKKDYDKGYLYRYFVQKTNDLTITEVNKENYNDISKDYYNKINITWILTGPEINQYKNKILDRKGVKEQNTKTLVDAEKKMEGIKNYIKNPLEFWAGK